MRLTRLSHSPLSSLLLSSSLFSHLRISHSRIPYIRHFSCETPTPANTSLPRLTRTVEVFSCEAPLRLPSHTLLDRLTHAEAASHLPSLSASFHLQRGTAHYNLGHWEAARDDFAKVLEKYDPSLYPSSLPDGSSSYVEMDEVLAKKATCLLNLKEFDQAAQVHMKWWLRAHISFLGGLISDSLVYYTKAIEEQPKPIFELYFNRGVVHTSLRKHEEALQDFSQAVSLSPPDNKSAIRWRGEVLAKLGRNQEAIEDLTLASTHTYEDPTYAHQISYWLGMCHLNLQNAEQALKCFSAITEEIPSAKYQRARALVTLGRFKEAVEDLEASSNLLEAGVIDKTEYYFLQAQSLYNTNAASKALESLALCNENHPLLKDNYTFLMLRGDCHFVLSKYSLALSNFKKAFELIPPQIAMRVPQTQPVVDLHMRIARCYVSLKNSKATGQELDKINPQRPTIEVAMQIGNLYLFIGQAEKAVKQYSQAIQLSSGKNYAEYIARGMAYMALGSKHESDSLNDFLQAQKLDPENAKDATYYIAKIHFNESLRILQDNKEFIALSHYYLSSCHWNLDAKDKAIESLNSAIEAKKDAKFFLQRAQFHEQLGKIDEAIHDFTELLSISGDDAEVYEQRARCYFTKRHHDKAIADISKALALQPNKHDDWYYLRAKIYAGLDAYSQAIKDLDSAISLAPAHPQYYYLRGVCYHHTEQFSSSAQDCKTMLQLWQSTPLPLPFHITYGSALFHLGDYEASATQYSSAIPSTNTTIPDASTFPKEFQAEAHFGMGRSLLFAGQGEEAMSHFQSAIQFSPSIVDKLELLQSQIAQMKDP